MERTFNPVMPMGGPEILGSGGVARKSGNCAAVSTVEEVFAKTPHLDRGARESMEQQDSVGSFSTVPWGNSLGIEWGKCAGWHGRVPFAGVHLLLYVLHNWNVPLPLRLLHVLAAIPPHGAVADIGAGDGQLALALAKRGAMRVIATEIGGSYPRLLLAVAHAPDAADRIETRRGPSLEPIQHGEVATIVIAGMGGHTIAGMLQEAVARNPQWIVLQPMQHAMAVEAAIAEQPCTVDAYDVCMDRGRSYGVWRLSRRSAR